MNSCHSVKVHCFKPCFRRHLCLKMLACLISNKWQWQGSCSSKDAADGFIKPNGPGVAELDTFAAAFWKLLVDLKLTLRFKSTRWTSRYHVLSGGLNMFKLPIFSGSPGIVDCRRSSGCSPSWLAWRTQTMRRSPMRWAVAPWIAHFAHGGVRWE